MLSMVVATCEVGLRYLAAAPSPSLEAKSFARASTTRRAVLELHTKIIDRGYGGDLFLSSAIIHRYLACNSVWDAWKIFSTLHETDVITWTRMIAAFAQAGHLAPSLHVFREMHLQGVPADSVTFVTLLNVCARFQALQHGRQIHSHLLERGFDAVPRVGNSLVDLYAKCGCLDEASTAFASLSDPDVISWNTLIAAHAACSGFKQTLAVYRSMELEGMKPDAFTLVTILNSCTDLATIASSTVKDLHERIISLGAASDTIVCNALVSMYGSGGQLSTARTVFESCCVRQGRDLLERDHLRLHGLNSEALHLYRRMQHEGQLPNDVALLSVMNACTGELDLSTARLIHPNVDESYFVTGSGRDNNEAQVRNALISMYGRCASLGDARAAFDAMPRRDVVSWNSLIAAYSVNGYCDFALELYHRMQLEGLRPTNVTFTTVLNACGESFLEQGRMIHANLIGTGYESAEIVVSALVDMYCKCGSLEDAFGIFEKHSRRGVVLWTSVIGGYADTGDLRSAVQLFRRMLLDGVKPNKVTLVTVINACANSDSVPAEVTALIRSLVAESGHQTDFAVKNALLNLFGKSGSLDDIEKTFAELEDCWDVIAGTVMVSAYCQLGLSRVIPPYPSRGYETESDNLRSCAHLLRCRSHLILCFFT